MLTASCSPLLGVHTPRSDPLEGRKVEADAREILILTQVLPGIVATGTKAPFRPSIALMSGVISHSASQRSSVREDRGSLGNSWP